MPIQTTCRRCTATLRFQDAAAGRRAKCPKCGALLDIPAASASAFTSTATDSSADDFPPPQRFATSQPREAETVLPAEPVVAATAAPTPAIPPQRVLPPLRNNSPPATMGSPYGAVPLLAFRPVKRSRPLPLPLLIGGGAALLLVLGFIFLRVAVTARSIVEEGGDADLAQYSIPSPEVPSPTVPRGPAANLEPALPVSGSSAPLATDLVVERIQDGVVLIVCFDRQNEESSLGSGFIIDSSGLIATNYHVIDEAASAKVQFHNQSVAQVVGVRAADARADLAILEVANLPRTAKVLSLAPNEKVRAAAKVLAIGHPAGFGFTVTDGIVSAVRKTEDLPGDLPAQIDAPRGHEWIQISAAISGGSSGGPLILADGRVIGINTWGDTAGKNLNFASHVKHLVDLKGRVSGQVLPLPGACGGRKR